MNINEAAKKKAEWLAYCLSIGYEKDDLDGLSNVWDTFKDEQGNLKELTIDSVRVSQAKQHHLQLEEAKKEIADLSERVSEGIRTSVDNLAKIHYWKQRCEAAEKVLETFPREVLTDQAGEDYLEYESLRNKI